MMTIPERSAHHEGKSKGFAMAALVLGIVSIGGAIFGWGGILLGCAGLALGIIALRKPQLKGVAITGIVTGSLGIIGGVAMLIVSAIFMLAFGIGL